MPGLMIEVLRDCTVPFSCATHSLSLLAAVVDARQTDKNIKLMLR